MASAQGIARFGTVYGGFYYPSSLNGIGPGSFVMCVGAGEDISHDVAIAAKTGATVHIVDPTPRAISHVQHVQRVLAEAADAKASGRAFEAPAPDARLGGGDATYWRQLLSHNPLPRASQFVLHPVALGTKSGRAAFFMPAVERYVSHSLVEGMTGNAHSIEVDVVTLPQLCQAIGRAPEELALLKLDIEGSECDVLEMMCSMAGVRPRYLAVDFDLGWNGKKIRDRKRCDQMIDHLQRSQGYRLIKQIGADHSFERRVAS
jgi:FkbM family methyltransferase